MQFLSCSPGVFEVYQNALLMDLPEPYMGGIPGNTETSLMNPIIAIFDESLEISNGTVYQGVSSISVNLSHNDNYDNINSNSVRNAEYLILEKFALCLKNSNVQLVCCQKRIHPYLQSLLMKEGIYFLQRVSIKFISALQGISPHLKLHFFSSFLYLFISCIVHMYICIYLFYPSILTLCMCWAFEYS